MAKILLGNDQECYELLRDNYIRSGFSKYNEYINKNFYLSSFKKLRIDNYNYLKIGEDFVATSGTLIYEGEIGERALRKIYENFDENVQLIRDKILGNYALVVKKGNCVYVFCDDNNIYDIYYYNYGGKWLISNNFYYLAKTLPDVQILSMELLEASFQHCIIDNKTPFDNIYKLMKDEYIKIDILMENFNIYEIECKKIEIAIKDLDFMAKEFANLLKKKVQSITKNIKNPAISMTGGLDSRIMLAAFLANGIKPRIVYGVGNSVITNTKERDLEINKIYAEKFNLNFYQMNWRTSVSIDENWKESLERYGELYTIYAANENMYKEFSENLNVDFIEYGYFGEIMRNVDWLEELAKENYTLDEFLESYYYNNSAISNQTFKEEYTESIKKKLEKICKKERLDKFKLSKNDFFRIHNYYRRRADTVMNNFSNNFVYSISVLSTWELLNYITEIPFEYKKNAKFMLKVIDYLYPPILEVPFFSHCKDYKFNRDTFCLESKNVMHDKMKKILKGHIKNKYIISMLIKINNKIHKQDYKSANEFNESLMLKKYFEKFILSNRNLQIHFYDFNCDVKCIVKLAQMILMISEVEKGKVKSKKI